MLLTYQPADASDLDALFAFNKELIDQYEDLSQIPYQKVLAWVRQKLEQQIQEYTCIFADGKKAGYYHFLPWTPTPWNWTTCICSPPSGVTASTPP